MSYYVISFLLTQFLHDIQCFAQTELKAVNAPILFAAVV